METVLINAILNEKKKSEFYQTMESLKILVQNYCQDFQIITNDDLSLTIQITFDDIDEIKNHFYGNEFNIMKGSLRSLCDNIDIKIGNVPVGWPDNQYCYNYSNSNIVN